MTEINEELKVFLDQIPKSVREKLSLIEIRDTVQPFIDRIEEFDKQGKCAPTSIKPCPLCLFRDSRIESLTNEVEDLKGRITFCVMHGDYLTPDKYRKLADALELLDE